MIYLYCITDDRLGRCSEQTYNLITKMCSTQNFTNIVIATTQWEKMQDKEDREHAEQLEAQLRSEKDFFEGLAAEGAAFMRHENTRATAESIVKKIMKNHLVVFQIQKEMVNEQKSLLQTNAGGALGKEVEESNKAVLTKIVELEAKIAEAKNCEDKITEEIARKDQEDREEDLKAGKEQLRRMNNAKSRDYEHKLNELRGFERESKRK